MTKCVEGASRKPYDGTGKNCPSARCTQAFSRPPSKHEAQSEEETDGCRHNARTGSHGRLITPGPPALYEQKKTIAIGADVLWFQPGTDTTEAIQLAAGADLTVVAGRCMALCTENWGSDRGHLGPFARRNLRSHNESEQVPNGTRSSHREDLHPLIFLLGDASTPADQYVSYQKKTNDRSLDHD